MSTKLTPKQERFAKEIVTAASQKEAAERAGYTPGPNAEARASENVRKSKVAERIAEVRKEAAGRNNVTEDSIIREYEEARIVGLETLNSSGMSTATTGKAKVCGLITDRYEDVSKLNEGELIRKAYESGLLDDLIRYHFEVTGERYVLSP